ncbi:MAG TPA: dephospho-CoA kinase [Acidimicrobiia bacterium]|nr:dephospho-CoA kinase [Acidimicrobiia bacterium]
MTARTFYLGGGIGSGKTAAGEILASLGAVVLSGDDAGRQVLLPGTPETAAVLARWPQAAAGERSIDRSALGAMVFADPSALAELEAITAPGIAERLMRAVAAHPDDTVLVEVPVLREVAGAGWPWVVVDAPDALRLQRAMERDPGRGEEQIRNIMARQPSRAEWLAAAEWVIDNGSDRDHLEAECRRLWAEIG